MNYGSKVLSDMADLIWLLAPHCEDRLTIDELSSMVADHRKWAGAHDLFNRIRNKTLIAERSKNQKHNCQHLFEEICAKTLYNLSGSSAPFDADSPYWIIPNALAFARRVGVDDSQVIKVVAA